MFENIDFSSAEKSARPEKREARWVKSDTELTAKGADIAHVELVVERIAQPLMGDERRRQAAVVATGALGKILDGVDEGGGQRIGGGRKNLVSAIELVIDGLPRRENVALDDEAVIVGTTNGTGRDD